MKEEYLGIIEINDDYIYLTKDENYLYSNGCTNAGNYHIDEYLIDEDLSLDENIQNFTEII